MGLGVTKRIYFDHAAATPLDLRVAKVMAPYSSTEYGNPSSVHAGGRKAKMAIEGARKQVAEVLGAQAEEIVFTSGATESINLGYRGIIGAAPKERRHVVTLATEHMATLRVLQDLGCEVTFLPVDEDGLVSADEVMKAIRPETVLVTMMYVNNEMGTILPIAEVGKMLAKMKRVTKDIYPIFYTDAVQAVNSLPLNVTKLHVDALCLSGSKMYGPKGSGALYIKKGTPIKAQIMGGTQEHGMRAGTENVGAIVGLAAALKIAQTEHEDYEKRLRPLQKMLFEGILEKIPGVSVNGHRTQRVCNNVNVSLPEVDGEAVVMYLDSAGIAASTASSCTSSAGASHVIKALGKSVAAAESSVRLTLGRGTTKQQVKKVIQELVRIVALLKIF
ncbi:TPA: cysteine desulfurase NifS [Candidatus Uhrbacteria bacterium]|nr:cysteine desulfurase NifS [Candidatus Uhrbacteria bacterium]